MTPDPATAESPSAWTRTLGATLKDLTDSMDECGRFLHQAGAPEEAVFAAHLAMEELITNTIKYGYPSDSVGKVFLHLHLHEKKFHLRMEDSAPEFDPFNQPPPDLTLPIHQRPVGGLGLHLIKNLMTTCHYRREEDRNVVLLEKIWD